MSHEFTHPVIGQEAVCPRGLGRVVAYVDAFPRQFIKVKEYINPVEAEWAPHNVQLVKIHFEEN